MVEPLVSEAPLGRSEMVSLAAHRGRAEAVAAAVLAEWQIELPTTPRCVVAGEIAFIWAGPERWLVTAPFGTDLEAALAPLADLAAITDQGAGRATFRVSGPESRDALANLIGIDLHPRAFTTGDTAMTVAAHINVQLWQVDDAPTYDLTVFRSLAASFERTLRAAGLQVFS